MDHVVLRQPHVGYLESPETSVGVGITKAEQIFRFQISMPNMLILGKVVKTF
jgi:hypothetical protein